MHTHRAKNNKVSLVFSHHGLLLLPPSCVWNKFHPSLICLLAILKVAVVLMLRNLFMAFFFCLDLILQPSWPPGPLRDWLLFTPKLAVSTLALITAHGFMVWVLGDIQISASVQL